MTHTDQTASAPADPNQPILILITFPDSQVAGEIVQELVQNRLVACGNIIPKIRSIYLWEDEVQDDAESLALCKTTQAQFPVIRDKVAERHPYDVPEILSFPVGDGLPAYLQWLGDCVSGKTESA